MTKRQSTQKYAKRNIYLVLLLGVLAGLFLGYGLTRCNLVRIDEGKKMFGWYETPINENCTKNTNSERYTCYYINQETICECEKK